MDKQYLIEEAKPIEKGEDIFLDDISFDDL